MDEFIPKKNVIDSLKEKKKRKKELFIIVILGIAFLLFSALQFNLFDISKKLPIVHAIFFFGLVNLNVILLLFLLFFIFRNVVKVFLERREKLVGSSLKTKLIASFVTFTFVPTLLLFLISVFYINGSFDRWFSIKVKGILKSSLDVTKEYYDNSKKKNIHFAQQIAEEVFLLKNDSSDKIKIVLKNMLKKFSLDAIEYYKDFYQDRILQISDDKQIPLIPKPSLEFLNYALKKNTNFSDIYHFSRGNLIRVIVPVKNNKGAIIVSSFVPLSLIAKMNDIASAYDEFRDTDPLEYPLKSIYLYILILMTLVILFAAIWFGFYLAQQLSIPLIMLGEATKRIANGDYRTVFLKSGSREVSSLVDSFNQMIIDLDKSRKEIYKVNVNLKQALDHLDKHNRYIEVVLRNVSAGVISLDQEGYITTINHHACKLLKINPKYYIKKHVSELLNEDYYLIFNDMMNSMRSLNVLSLNREVKIDVKGNIIPLQITLSILKDENDSEIGKIIVFDDLTMLENAQRAKAWRDVARRIAHEIKNPLTPIKLAAQRLQNKFAKDINNSVFEDCTKMIIQQVDGLKTLVDEFSNFARLPQTKPVVSSLNNLIKEVLILYQMGHNKINFVFQLDNDLPEFKFDPEQLKRVLVNLIDNAIYAVRTKEKPIIEIITNYDKLLKIVRLSIIDNGEGIFFKNHSRIFEPYFTDKVGGTGLGLSIVKRIIDDHNGFIRIQENHPGGIKMLIEIPVVELSSWITLNKNAFLRKEKEDLDANIK